MAKKKIICDTNIVIAYFRQEMEIVQELDKIGFDSLYLSVVTVAELLYGMKKKEIIQTKITLNKFSIIDFDKEVSNKWIELMWGHCSGRLSLPDAMIAATCLVENAELYTHNIQDIKIVKGIKLYKSKKIK